LTDYNILIYEIITGDNVVNTPVWTDWYFNV